MREDFDNVEIISNLRITTLRSYMERIIPLWKDNLEDFGFLHVWNYFQFKNYNCFFERTIWKILALYVRSYFQFENYNLKWNSFFETIWKILAYMFEIISNLRITILIKWNSFFDTIRKILTFYMFEIISNLRITIVSLFYNCLKLFPIWVLRFLREDFNNVEIIFNLRITIVSLRRRLEKFWPFTCLKLFPIWVL